MSAITPNIDTIRAPRTDRLTIIGSGSVAKSILLASALAGPRLPIRVLCRSTRGAELVRCYLNDLPPLDVDVALSAELPDLSGELVVLAAGRRTEGYARRSKKEELYAENAATISTWLDRLQDSIVVVTTNPSTRITKYLIEQGVEAYGAGVENDQLRFLRHSAGVAPDQFLIGGHNFFDLIIGHRQVPSSQDLPFSLTEYKSIIGRQDAARTLFSARTGRFLDYDWESLSAVNESVHPAYRWYARQRIHSKFSGTAISGAIGVLDIVATILQLPVRSEFVTVELPVNIPGVIDDCVMGWPIYSRSRKPLALWFDEADLSKLREVAGRYRIAAREVARPEDRFLLATPFGAGIELCWRAEDAYAFHSLYLSNLMSVARVRQGARSSLGRIVVRNERAFFDEAVGRAGAICWQTVPQHRSRNPAEHADLQIAHIGDMRAVKFPGGGVGLVDDRQRHIDFHCDDIAVARHELRRIIRDEMAVPLMLEAGCRLLHAGFIEYEGAKVLIVGRSGSGKTTLALALLGDDEGAKYGSAERTLVWVEGGRLVALGVPESITVFPGNLRDTVQFGALVDEGGEENDWARESKQRLQQFEIVRRTGTSMIPGQGKVDLVVEVNYDDQDDLVERIGARMAPATLEDVLAKNDLSRVDRVRLAWLDWFNHEAGAEFYRELNAMPAKPPAFRVSWRQREALMDVVLNLVARMRIGRPAPAAQ